jgi:DUF1365 family protein
MITMPRYFGYAFNPVTFYYCYKMGVKPSETALRDGVCVIVTEINNTFGEKHIYVTKNDQSHDSPEEKSQGALIDLQKKSFHVSPFNGIERNYHFVFTEVD